MKLHRLEIAGFGPFRDRQVVDFDSFADDGIFLIAGRTGAGKSSILDAVCFALYGSVPRFAGAKGSLRSDHCDADDPSEVVAEFTTTAGRFRVTRSPEYERAAKRAGATKTVTEKERAVLERRDGEVWVGVAAKPRDVGHEISGILQLSREQFLQVILLAQNRFAEFLLAKSSERRDLLRQLFGSHRFEVLRERFDERRKVSAAALGETRSAVATRLDDAWEIATAHELLPEATAQPVATGERWGVLDTALDTARATAARRDAERAAAEAAEGAATTALTEARDVATAQRARAAAQRDLAALDAAEEEITRLRAAVDRAAAAEGLRVVMQAAERAEVEHAAAVAQREEATNHFAEQIAGDDRAPDAADDAAVRSWVAAQRETLGRWQALVELEDSGATRLAQVADAERQHQGVQDALTALAAEREGLPARVEALTRAVEDAVQARDQLPHATEARDAARVRSLAAAEAARLRERAISAEQQRAVAQQALAAAEQQLATLLQRRVDGMAGELAAQLTPGEPCAVCGATAHPAPAQHHDPVSADDVTAAEAQRSQASLEERKATEAAAQAQLAVTAAESAAGGIAPDDAEAAVAAAEQTLGSLSERAAQAEARTMELESLRTRQGALDDERVALTASLASLGAAVVAAKDAVAHADVVLAEARGEHDSVGARRRAVTAQVDAGEALLTALRGERHAVEAAVQRTAERHEALAASPFDDLAQVTAAMASADQREEWAQRVEQHTLRRHTVTELLRTLAERQLPEAAVNLEPLERHAAQARDAWQSAIAAATGAARTATQLADLLDTARADQARSAAQEQAHEVLENLALTIAGSGPNTRKMSLETFVLAAELEEIVDAANRRLRDISAGRYALRYTDARASHGAASGLGIVVNDAFTGQERTPQSLSGGETFLASLSLALGLAEVVTGRAGGLHLETLFIDEGFGSLDADTLEVAMRTLDELRQGGRTVGVISHVEAMQDAIPAQLRVEATDRGPSVIRS